MEERKKGHTHCSGPIHSSPYWALYVAAASRVLILLCSWNTIGPASPPGIDLHPPGLSS